MEADSGGPGGIGGGGGSDIGGKNKGKNIPNQAKIDAEIRREQSRKRQRENDLAGPSYELPPQDYGDGSQILKHLVLAYPDLLGSILDQIKDDCWAISLVGILLFNLNKDRPTNQHKDVDIEKFIRDVRFSAEEMKSGAHKNLTQTDVAVGSLKKAMNHLFHPGLEKEEGRKGPRVSTYRSEFRDKNDASPDFIAQLLETKNSPVGIIVAANVGFVDHKDGILVLRKEPGDSDIRRHALLIVAYGRMKDGKLLGV